MQSTNETAVSEGPKRRPLRRQLRKQKAAARKLVRSVLPERNAPHLKGGISIFVTSAIVLEIVLLLLHFMIYETLVTAFGIGGWPLKIALGLLSLTFISASILSARLMGPVMRAYYKIAGLWFAFVAPLCGACFAFALIEDASIFLGHPASPWIVGDICFGAAIAITLYGMANSVRAGITRIKVSVPHLSAFWKTQKMVFVSDLQLGNIFGKGFSAKVVRKIQSVDPAVVFVGGDLYDGVKCDPDQLIEPFKDLHPPLGTYFISGNHEYIRDADLFFAAIKRAGMTILKNEMIDLQGIQLIGVDFNDTDAKEHFVEIMGEFDIDSKKPTILLRHVPDYLDVAEHFGVSLMLSGHTHRGQFFPLNYITKHIYKGYDYGLKQFGKMMVYTSSGAGAWMSPFRLGTKSEIVLIEFE